MDVVEDTDLINKRSAIFKVSSNSSSESFTALLSIQ